MRKSVYVLLIMLVLLFSGCNITPSDIEGQETMLTVPTAELTEALTPTEAPVSMLEATVTLEPTPTVTPTSAAEITVTPEPTVTPTFVTEITVTPEPTVTPTSVFEITVTPEPTATPIPIPKETATPEPTPTRVPTSTPKATATPKPTPTRVPTSTPKATATPKPTPTRVPTSTPKATATPEPTPTRVPTSTPKATATPKPTPTRVPTSTPKVTATPKPTPTVTSTSFQEIQLSDIPLYSGKEYVVLNENQPYFTEYSTESFERYSDLDALGRCGVAFACIGRDIMPTEKRGETDSINPSGWHTVRYDASIIEGRYLYNRCHLIGYQLTGENKNEKNLITGTRFLNVQGMQSFENKTADYIERTGNHVMYRVTPMFEGDNLVATGVRMEGWSVEDQGEGICFHIFVYNVQPGITINYATGESALATVEEEAAEEGARDYVLNTRTNKFHIPSCSSVDDMSEKNKKFYTGRRETVIERGYEPCKRCKP